MKGNQKLLRLGNLTSAFITTDEGDFAPVWEATLAGVILRADLLEDIAFRVAYPKSREERLLNQECRLAASVGLRAWSDFDEADLICNRQGHQFVPFNPIDFDWDLDDEDDNDDDW